MEIFFHISILDLFHLAFTVDNDGEVAAIADIISVFNKRVSTALPKTSAGFQKVLQDVVELASQGGRRRNVSQAQISKVIAKNNLARRDVNWLKENGICMEKIRPGKSTIKGAGRGAFTQVSIKKGEIIAPAPLLTIAKKDAMFLYKGNSTERPIGKQLLINYCFGHRDVDLILCPQTNGILVNHCGGRESETEKCNDGKGPNAIVRWARDWDVDTADWLELTVDEIKKRTAKGRRGLSLEFIATRDISPGEEVSLVCVLCLDDYVNIFSDHISGFY